MMYSGKTEWFFLDPDNRKSIPDDINHCQRCGKEIFFHGVLVERHPDHPWVHPTRFGRFQVGADCWKKIEKDRVIFKQSKQ